MKKYFLCVAAFLVLPVAANASFFGDDTPPPPQVCATGVGFDTVFSTSAAVAPAVAQEIAAAKKSIRMAARMFGSKPLSEALIAAKRRGVSVQVVLDKKSNDTGYSNATFLQLMSNPPRMTKNGTDLYVNYIIIDDNELIVGDVTSSVDADAEKASPVGALILHNAPDIAKRYLANWQVLWDNSEDMKREK